MPRTPSSDDHGSGLVLVLRQVELADAAPLPWVMISSAARKLAPATVWWAEWPRLLLSTPSAGLVFFFFLFVLLFPTPRRRQGSGSVSGQGQGVSVSVRVRILDTTVVSLEPEQARVGLKDTCSG